MLAVAADMQHFVVDDTCRQLGPLNDRVREKRGHCTDGGYCVTPRRCFPVGLNLLVVHTARGARVSVLSVFVSLTSVLSVCQSDLCPVCLSV